MELLTLAWRGRDSQDKRIFRSTFGREHAWAPQELVPGANTAIKPFLASGPDGSPFMTWREATPDQRIWSKYVSGNMTSPARVLFPAKIGSSFGMAMAARHQEMVGVWKGVTGDERIWAVYSINVADDYVRVEVVPGALSRSTPALAYVAGVLHMAWQGRADRYIYWATRGDHGWSTPQRIPDRATEYSPALGVYGRDLYMVWRGAHSDTNLWWSVYDHAGSWSPQAPIPGIQSAYTPALAAFEGKLYMAWRARDAGIHWSFSDGTHWAPEQVVPNVATYYSPALSAQSSIQLTYT